MKYYENIKTLRCNAEEYDMAVWFMMDHEIDEVCVDWHNYKAEHDAYISDVTGLLTWGEEYEELWDKWYALAHSSRYDFEFSFWG